MNWEAIKVVVAAGGDGTRMHEITKGEPKALLMINGRPLISYQLEIFRDLGFKKVLMSFDNKKNFLVFDEMIEKNLVPNELEYTYGMHDEFDHPGKLFCEKDTKEFIKENSFLYTQSDLVFEPRLIEEMTQAFEDYNCLVIRRGDRKEGDRIEYLCKNDFLVDKKEVEAGKTTWREGGMYIVPKEDQDCWLETFSEEQPMTIKLLNKFIEEKKNIKVVDYNGIFINMNTNADYLRVCEFLEKVKVAA